MSGDQVLLEFSVWQVSYRSAGETRGWTPWVSTGDDVTGLDRELFRFPFLYYDTQQPISIWINSHPGPNMLPYGANN